MKFNQQACLGTPVEILLIVASISFLKVGNGNWSYYVKGLRTGGIKANRKPCLVKWSYLKTSKFFAYKN